MEESVSTIVAHLAAVMDSLIRASVCETTKLLQEPVNDYLVELSLSKRENEALKHENRAQRPVKEATESSLAWGCVEGGGGSGGVGGGGGGGAMEQTADCMQTQFHFY